MKKSMVFTMVLGLLLALSVPLASAQTAQTPAQTPAQEEAAAYKAWYDAFTAKDYAKVYQLGKEFMVKYPSSQYAPNVKKYIPGMRAFLFNEARKTKNMQEELRLGKEALAENAEDLDYLYLMAIDIRANEMEASPANYSHAADAADFSQRAAKLIEAGKPSNVFKSDAAKSVLAYLYQTSAMIEAKNSNQDKAVELYKKSSVTDPANGLLNAQNYLALGVIYQLKYAAVAKKFDELPAEKKSNADDPDTKAALQAINDQADAVIDAWAHFLALPDSAKYGKTADNVKAEFIKLWKFRHEDKEDGYQDFINKFKPVAASPTMPPSGATTAAATAKP
ncbi:MAG: hypothetical protein HY231_21950 [Acidobacteria bacterium]|nr:hypothetical protein [Acidobacteriota bacterium]